MIIMLMLESDAKVECTLAVLHLIHKVYNVSQIFCASSFVFNLCGKYFMHKDLYAGLQTRVHKTMKGTEVPNPRRSSACDCTCVLTRINHCLVTLMLAMHLPMQSSLTNF